MLQVAVVGAGPAGVYATAALTDRPDVRVDVIDRLPCPFGLVRYGVAPDHPKIRSISGALTTILERPAVRFLGNVEVGTVLSLADLHEHYDAIVLASGAAVDRRLQIPGEDLPGSSSATEFVAWYCGHPDSDPHRFALSAESVAVVGLGNVALDVARMLTRPAEDLVDTTLPEQVLEVLRASTVRDLHLVGRRGPAQARFTTKELRELGELADVDLLVDADELVLDDDSAALVESEPVLRRNLEVLTEWAARTPAGRPRRIHLHFMRRPVEVLAGSDGRVAGLRLERTQLDERGHAVGTGQYETLDVGMVLRSVGYRGLPIPGMPFDPGNGTIPNQAGRVVHDGAVVPGEYVAGWAKRGPSGVIGTNKHDANETVASLVEDAAALPEAPVRDPQAILDLLRDRGAEVVDWQGWRAIVQAEVDLGRRLGRGGVTIADRQALLAAAGVTADLL